MKRTIYLFFAAAGLLLCSPSAAQNKTPKKSSGSRAVSEILDLLTPATATTAEALHGTWNYKQPAVAFESDNLLAKAGGIAAAGSIEEKLGGYYAKAGIKPDSFSLTFNENGTFTGTVGRRTLKGNYTFDDEKKSVRLEFLAAGVRIGSATGAVRISAERRMTLVFDATHLLNMVKTLSSISKSATFSTISSIAESYDGMKAGFTFGQQ